MFANGTFLRYSIYAQNEEIRAKDTTVTQIDPLKYIYILSDFQVQSSLNFLFIR